MPLALKTSVTVVLPAAIPPVNATTVTGVSPLGVN
jgi:hypothetical protein